MGMRFLVYKKRLKSVAKLTGYRKSKLIYELLGCSVQEFKHYIESKFKKGMSWANHGIHTWHIDHIKPVCSFDLTKEYDRKECFHYTNLQPLWANENLRKSGKYEEI